MDNEQGNTVPLTQSAAVFPWKQVSKRGGLAHADQARKMEERIGKGEGCLRTNHLGQHGKCHYTSCSNDIVFEVGRCASAGSLRRRNARKSDRNQQRSTNKLTLIHCGQFNLVKLCKTSIGKKKVSHVSTFNIPMAQTLPSCAVKHWLSGASSNKPFGVHFYLVFQKDRIPSEKKKKHPQVAMGQRSIKDLYPKVAATHFSQDRLWLATATWTPATGKPGRTSIKSSKINNRIPSALVHWSCVFPFCKKAWK